METRRQILSFIRRERLTPAGDQVIVGVSGGPDSLCLLHVLWTCREELGIAVHAAHLDHLIRGQDAKGDARFVANLATEWGVPCTVQARDVPAYAREHKMAIEEAARRVRYAFLAEVARGTGAKRIAVGHNADDQSETVLMHWLRGSGLAGLRGMLPATRMADLRLGTGRRVESDLWLVRPLLETPRSDVERYCRQQGLVPRLDRSNLDTTLYRNKLRHELLPYLEREYKPHFRQVLRRSANVIRAGYDLLGQLCDDAWSQVVRAVSGEAVTFDRGAWVDLHLALQRATLRRAVQHLRWNLRDVSFQHVDAAVGLGRRGTVGSRATLPRNLALTVGYRTLIVADDAYVPPPDFPALSETAEAAERVELAMPGVTTLAGACRVTVRVVSPGQLPARWRQNTDPWLGFLDSASLGGRIFLRGRRTGDRFRPFGMGGKSKSISEFMINEKVPAWWRDRVPLLVREDDEVMWVCGWRMDERARIDNRTERAVVIRLDLPR